MRRTLPEIMAIITLMSALDEFTEASNEEVKEAKEAGPDEIVLLGKHPDGQAIGVCVPCTKSIFDAMRESNELFWQSKDDKLEKFTALQKCDGTPSRFHMTLRQK